MGYGLFGRLAGISAIDGILDFEDGAVNPQSHNDAFEQLGRRIDDLRSDMNANFARLDGRIGLVEGRLDGRIDRLESKLDSRFQWMIGIQMTSWLTVMLAIFFKH
jgi:hypothetical protein